jgi:hypothetical protein
VYLSVDGGSLRAVGYWRSRLAFTAIDAVFVGRTPIQSAINNMPVTPFHFGPSLLVKAAAPRSFSMIAFGVSQIVIDCETRRASG